jgi:oxidoreductase
VRRPPQQSSNEIGAPIVCIEDPSLLFPGQEIVRALVQNPRWATVTTVGRRRLEPAPPGAESKLVQVVIDMDALETQAAGALAGAHSTFVALGTTRGAAGSAEAFKRVDHDYVVAAVRASAQAGVPHFALVSAQGANASLPANDWRIAHGLLYSKLRGEVEAAATNAGFKAGVTIARPGFLERGDKARAVEKAAAWVLPSVAASKVAATLIAEAEKAHAAAEGNAPPAVKILSMKDLQNYAA